MTFVANVFCCLSQGKMGGKGSQKRNGEQVRTGASWAVKSGECVMSR